MFVMDLTVSKTLRPKILKFKNLDFQKIKVIPKFPLFFRRKSHLIRAQGSKGVPS